MKCNPHPVIRSLLSFAYEKPQPAGDRYRYAYYVPANDANPSEVPTSHNGLPDFTINFGSPINAEDHEEQSAEDEVDELADSEKSIEASAPMSNHDKKRLGEAQLARLQDVVDRPARRSY